MKTCSKCNIEQNFDQFAKRKERKSGYSSNCKSCMAAYSKQYYKREGVKEKLIQNQKKYRKNPEFRAKEQQYRYQYEKKRLKEDVLFRLRKNLRSRISHLLRRSSIEKTGSTIKWLGCSLLELKKHLEIQFDSKMTWENYGIWTIDHIIPLSRANNEKELEKLCHYTNLQPLWLVDNIRKGNK